jgi:flagellar biosynthesis GTPase FlhF
MLEALATKVLDVAADSALEMLSDAVKRKNAQLLRKHQQQKKKDPSTPAPTLMSATLDSARPALRDALVKHVESVGTWCNAVKFSDLRGTKSLAQVYIQLDTYLMPLSLHESDVERSRTEPLLDAIRASPSHCVILGTAGAGKTTSMQKICSDFFKQGKALAGR